MRHKLLAGGLICLTVAAVPSWCLFDDYWWIQQIALATRQVQQDVAIYESLMSYKQMYDEVSAVVRNPGGIMNAVNASLAISGQLSSRVGTSSRIEVLRGTLAATRTIMGEIGSIRTLSSGNAAAYGSLLSQTQQATQELQALEQQGSTDLNRGRYADQSFTANSQVARSYRWQ